MKTEWWIAHRYFQGKGFLSFIKTMAIGGIAVGSAGLLISLSIVHGFKSVITEKTLSFAPHITITAPFEDSIQRTDTLLGFLATVEGVESAIPIVTTEIMIQGNGLITGGMLMGIEADRLHEDVEKYISEGVFSAEGVVLGDGIANDLGVQTGSSVYLFSINGLPEFDRAPSIAQFTVTGIYKTGIDRFDEGVLFASAESVRKLTGRGILSADQIDIRLTLAKDKSVEEQIGLAGQSLRSDLSFPYVVETIFQRYRNLFEWIKLQEQTIPFVISIMILIGAFNLIGTILMMVLERTQDIGILKTLGLNTGAVRRIFLIEGVLVAGYGLLAGWVISIVFMWSQLQFGWIRLSEENYYMSVAPIEPHATDFILVTVITLVLSLLASVLPANVAAKSDPIQSISFQA